MSRALCSFKAQRTAVPQHSIAWETKQSASLFSIEKNPVVCLSGTKIKVAVFVIVLTSSLGLLWSRLVGCTQPDACDSGSFEAAKLSNMCDVCPMKKK